MVEGDLRDRASLDRACGGCSAVVSAAAVTGEKKPPPGGYDAINVDGIANLARAAAAAGVDRIVHFSGLDGAGDDAGPYLRGRRAGEDALERAGAPWTILRPSIQFGPHAPFFAAMADLVRKPLTPVAGDGSVRLQPIHVDDAARCAVATLDEPGHANRELQLGGPDVFSLDEILDLIGDALGRGRVRKVHVPMGLVAMNARLLQFLPRPPVRPAAIELLSFDNVANSTAVVEQEFGFRPRDLRGHLSAHGLEL